MWQAKAHTELTLSPLPATAVGQSLLKYGTLAGHFEFFLCFVTFVEKLPNASVTFHSLRTQDMRQQPYVQQFYRW